MPEEKVAEKKSEDLIREARNFFSFYKKDIGKAIRAGKNIIDVNFGDIASFSHVLAEQLISTPEEIFQVLEVALEESGLVVNPRVRLLNLPEMQFIRVRNIRAKHLNQLISIEGIVRQASEVRPQVINAKFVCPSCGTIISILQIEKRFREPSRCSCGRKGQFRLVSKDMVDAQRIVIEESPESLTGGEQPRRISVFLKEDLVEPRMEERSTPGSRVKIIGILKEVPVPLQTGAISTRFDLAIEANNIIPLEETFEEFEISEEDERQIQELAADKQILQKMIGSIAPSIYGYDEIKQALVLQLFGGVKKKRADGTDSRGDIHILLVGDPGVAKSLSKNEKILYLKDKEFGYVSIEKLFEKFGKYPKALKTLTIDMENHEPRWEKVSEIIKHLPEKDLIKIKTEHGKTITATKDHSFITLSKSGEIIPIKGEELTKETYVPIPINYHKKELKYLFTGHFNKKTSNNSRLLPDKIELDKDFGFFIGTFLAEGYIRSGNAINISNKDKEIQNKIIKFSKKININYYVNEKGVLLHSKNLSDILAAYCYNKEDLKFIKKGIKGNFSRIKKIPDFSFFSPKEFIYGLISGLFSGDGRLIKDKKMLKGFELITISKILVEGTSDLLFSVGILNKIKEREYSYKGKRTNYYSLSVPTQMIEKFTEVIDIFGREIRFNKNKPIYSYNNLIPCGKLVYELTRKLGYNSRISGNRTFAAEMRTVKKRNTIGRLRLLRIIKEFESKAKERIPELEILKKIANSNTIWSKIKEIEILKKKNEEVYDLSVPSTNTFVANGIGVHNSIILKFISSLAPKGRYVVGRGSSAAGLTASVVRDEFLRGWSLEAGAMVLSNKGLVAVDEIEKMNPEDRSAMHEAMEQQCYLPNLEITLTDNSKKKIGPFVDSLMNKNRKKVQRGINCEILPLEENIKTLTTDFESIYPIRINKVSRHIAHGNFVKIKLRNGRKITVTPNHPCWTFKDGKIITIPAKDLKENDFFPIPAELPIEGKEQSLLFLKNSPQLCKLLGYHITDGCYELNRGKKNGIQFCNTDKKLIDDYFNTAKSIFNVNPIITKRDNRLSVRIISKKVVESFKNLDKNLLEKGKFKKIPNQIMKCKKEDIAFLLRSLFDGDGTIVKIKRNGCRISLISENRELAEQVTELLLRFGILSSIYEDREFFKVDICGEENLRRFYQNIGFLSEKKQNRLKEYLSKQRTYRSISDILPVTSSIKKIFKHLKINEEKYLGNQICTNCHKHRFFLQKMVKIAEEKVNRLILEKKIVINTANSKELGEVRKKLEFSALSTSKKIGISDYMLNQHEKRKITNKNYQRILLLEIENMLSILPELKEIKKLAFGKIRWSKVKSVETIKNKGIKWVYDITVEPTHSFISNNMVLHNSVTISKANVQASLRAETSVLAAANPKLGRFEPFQVIAQQIDMPPTLLNRFDVIFILRDLPDRGKDEAIATHVLLEHKKEGKKQAIDKELFRKYIAYSKQRIRPILTDAAVDEIKRFYVELRNAPVSAEGVLKPIPISARQLEAMIRLSEAAAKAKLRKKVSREEAKLAIDIMKYYLMQVGFDQETKTFDIDRIATGVSTSQRGRIILVREALSRLESRMGKLIPIEELHKELEEKMAKEEIEDSIQKLKQTGDIFEPRKGYVQRV